MKRNKHNKPLVLFILHLPPPVHGASIIGKYIKESDIINSNFECIYINLSGSKELNQIGKFKFAKIKWYLSTGTKIFKTLLSRRVELCYLTLNSKGKAFYKDFGLVLMLKLFKAKILYHFHNKGVSLFQHKVLDDLLYKITFKNSRLILLSPLLYYDVEKYLPQNKIYYCPNGIEVAKKNNYKKRNTDRVNILFVSNIMKEKGVFDLLKACSILKEKNLSFRCDFVGDWFDISEKIFKEEVKNKKLENYVFAHGSKYGNEKYKFYENAEIFTVPSHNECFSLVNLEAMQFSLPIVSTSEGATPEVIQNNINGFIIEKADIEDLAKKIEKLILNPTLRKQFGEKNYEKFMNNYTKDIFERRLNSIFEEILKK